MAVLQFGKVRLYAPKEIRRFSADWFQRHLQLIHATARLDVVQFSHGSADWTFGKVLLIHIWGWISGSTCLIFKSADFFSDESDFTEDGSDEGVGDGVEHDVEALGVGGARQVGEDNLKTFLKYE